MMTLASHKVCLSYVKMEIGGGAKVESFVRCRISRGGEHLGFKGGDQFPVGATTGHKNYTEPLGYRLYMIL